MRRVNNGLYGYDRKSAHRSPPPVDDGCFSLKEMQAHDAGSDCVFFSDFARSAVVQFADGNPKTMDIAVISDEIGPFTASVTGRTQGRSALDMERSQRRTYVHGLVFQVRESDFGPRPAISASILIDGKRYAVAAVNTFFGIHEITAEVNKG